MSDQPKWTPGPWIVFTSEDEWGCDTFVGTLTDTLFDVRPWKAPAWQEANAHLIAAAPDMAPLVEVLASLPIGPNTADDVPLYGLDGVYITHGHVRAARAALAKARGEAK